MQWNEVINNPLLQNLPFKIELNKFGKLLMSPASNQHGRSQMRIGYQLFNHLPNGEVIAECSITTPDGVKVVSPSNSKIEIEEKVALYLGQGAVEVWVVYDNGKILTFDHSGEIKSSVLAPDAQHLD